MATLPPCLNQLLKDEQIVMMRYARAADGREIAACQRLLLRLKASLRPHPYPHRPFAWRATGPDLCTPNTGTF